LIKQVQHETGIKEPDQARTALEIVAASLVRRITADEAKDFISQLPSLLQPRLRAVAAGPDRAVTRDSIEQELVTSLGIDRASATRLLPAIAKVSATSISAGEVEQVRTQLPSELQSVLTMPSPGL